MTTTSVSSSRPRASRSSSRAVKVWSKSGSLFSFRMLEVLGVRVPGVVVDLDAVPEQVPGHVHEPHARLDQPAGDQRALAEQRAAVAVEQSRVFASTGRTPSRSLDEVSRSKARCCVRS